MSDPAIDGYFRDRDLWAVILGGSSGFGLATARRLASAGLNLVLAHKDPMGVVEEVLEPAFDEIRATGVTLITQNGDLGDEEERGELLDRIEEAAGPHGVHLMLHSIAAGSCKHLTTPSGDAAAARAEALVAIERALAREGNELPAGALARACDSAFRTGGHDCLAGLVESRQPPRDEPLEESDIERTLAMMGFDFALWGRELLTCGLLAPKARLIALTSEGSRIAWEGYGAVSAAKATLEALCRSMALELGPHDVRCCIVQAGVTDTPAGNAIPGFDLMKARARARNPLGRLTRPDDVADAIYALSLPLLDWANGAVLTIDGGESIAGLV